MNPMERFRSNLKVACMLKIEPETWFSPHLAAYIRHVASYYQVDAHAMVLAIINGIATTCRSTYVNRTSHFMVPCNLYNILVARSGYSKSNILDLAQLIGETAAVYFQQSEENKEDEIREENSSEISGLSVVSTVTTKNVLRKSIKVVFNDGTPAGILNNLKQCARTMHLHEADVTLKSFGLLLPSPFDITPPKLDSFRSTLMTLHEKPGHFCRILKNEEIDISGSKLNIFVPSTGDLVAAELVRQAASLSADALFERFLLWPLDGEPIPNEKCITSIDYSQFCSLEQFSVLCGFFADLILELEPVGKQILADQAYEFRITGMYTKYFSEEKKCSRRSEPDTKDNVSARLNKTALGAYRIAGLCALAEAAFDLVPVFINNYVTFGNGKADQTFFRRATEIATARYGSILRKEENFIITTEICKRAQSVTVQNLAQYMSLMKILPEDKKNWIGTSGRFMKPVMINNTRDENCESAESIDTFSRSINISRQTTLPLTRKQENMIKNSNKYKTWILLHNSLIFIKSNLYTNSFLKKASSILESNFLIPLVNDGYLLSVPNGLICTKSKSTVYVKIIPSDDDDSREKFCELLSKINNERLNYNTYMESCKNISLNTVGVVSQDFMKILQQERYQRLNIDFTYLLRRNNSENQIRLSDAPSSILTEDTRSTYSENVFTMDDDNYSTTNIIYKTNLPRHTTNNNYPLDIILNNDESMSNNQLMVTHEEIIEDQFEVSCVEHDLMTTESSIDEQDNIVCEQIFHENSVKDKTNAEHDTINNNHPPDIYLSNDDNDESMSNVDQLMIVQEEIIEDQFHISRIVQDLMTTKSSTNEQDNIVCEQTLHENSIEDEYTVETIVDRIKNRKRKRTNASFK
ncbi:unnamed protein product [Rotaria sp. Silwood2]|nr:unnamed protein product [Rotaria sp. Silwood2]